MSNGTPDLVGLGSTNGSQSLLDADHVSRKLGDHSIGAEDCLVNSSCVRRRLDRGVGDNKDVKVGAANRQKMSAKLQK